MLSGIASWFTALSTTAKVAVAATTGGVILAGAGAVTPQISYQDKIDTVSIPFKVVEEKNCEMLVGERTVKIPGQNGERTAKFKITLSNGKETKREEIADTSKTVREPIDQTDYVGCKSVNTEDATEELPFKSIRQVNNSLLSGQTNVMRAGIKGSKTVTYEIVRLDGVEKSRTKKAESVISHPQDEIIGVGPPQPTNCQGYSPCITPGPDVDCANGSGNGPRYVGRVYVSGSDPYDLDRDGDGVGCE